MRCKSVGITTLCALMIMTGLSPLAAKALAVVTEISPEGIAFVSKGGKEIRLSEMNSLEDGVILSIKKPGTVVILVSADASELVCKGPAEIAISAQGIRKLKDGLSAKGKRPVNYSRYLAGSSPGGSRGFVDCSKFSPRVRDLCIKTNSIEDEYLKALARFKIFDEYGYRDNAEAEAKRCAELEKKK